VSVIALLYDAEIEPSAPPRSGIDRHSPDPTTDRGSIDAKRNDIEWRASARRA